ncbi:DNA cytosine methyltransferase [Enterobacter hormaechei]|uniref:DNA cytosine methyltransferase n=1 Tax=Enterobacter hormaechei TaxID=158836 RepID=UPI0013D084A8|nr:DNA cytosine methyltransferase [Enterobacter hormaechei]ELC6492773.1 DNA cytosine methyltransferase [Enterobacter hormaechei]MCU4096335.1 DNA cytosine methyltransferase [Enterobacter hormaechei subsp. steigerwaltii]
MKVIDFFCGCGGASKGFELAGFDIALGIDFDKNAADSYKANFPDTAFINDDIRNVKIKHVAEKVPDWKENDFVFCACAPCQPFSSQNKKRHSTDTRRSLLSETKRFIRAFRPKYIFIENVPGIQSVKLAEAGPFADFLNFLARFNYQSEYHVVSSEFYGVPQQRKRLVVLAKLNGSPAFPIPTHGKDGMPFATVRDYIGQLPSLQAGESDPNDPLHVAAIIEPLNIERLQHTPEGGDRRNWPKRLWLKCHKDYDGHTDVYGRMHWDEPCKTLTTKCTSISNGRFGHPDTTQHRAITFREAALLQTFPLSFQFKGNRVSKSKQIGNAVPVLLARRFAEAMWKQHQEELEGLAELTQLDNGTDKN